ncbi:MAG TPA: hypothetical protein VE735_09980 [Gammaproteobacteria bacterium]|nr:hypothetical protein [Gammaproteobacteria bacterium]
MIIGDVGAVTREVAGEFVNGRGGFLLGRAMGVEVGDGRIDLPGFKASHHRRLMHRLRRGVAKGLGQALGNLAFTVIEVQAWTSIRKHHRLQTPNARSAIGNELDRLVTSQSSAVGFESHRPFKFLPCLTGTPHKTGIQDLAAILTHLSGLAEKASHLHLQPLVLHAPLDQDPIHLHHPRGRLERVRGQGQRLGCLTAGQITHRLGADLHPQKKGEKGGGY